jgi:arginine/ornithine N-succinyltransferase beta subunit
MIHPLDRGLVYVRAALPEDVPSIIDAAAASHYQTCNFSGSPDFFAARIEESTGTFSLDAAIGEGNRSYVFSVLENLTPEARAVGTSSFYVHRWSALKGYWRYQQIEGSEGNLDSHLHLTESLQTASEAGALILHPSFRNETASAHRAAQAMESSAGAVSRKEHGLAISMVRFFWLALAGFDADEKVIVEFNPLLTREGNEKTNLFYEYIARPVYRGRSYADMDHLTQEDPSFFRRLPLDIQLDDLPDEVRSAIGQVAEGTPAAMRLLEKIGFQHDGAFDALDGAPHAHARLGDIPVYSGMRIHPFGKIIEKTRDRSDWQFGLMGLKRDQSPHFEAVAGPYILHKGKILTTAEAAVKLKLAKGMPLAVSSLDLKGLKKSSSFWGRPPFLR